MINLAEGFQKFIDEAGEAVENTYRALSEIETPDWPFEAPPEYCYFGSEEQIERMKETERKVEEILRPYEEELNISLSEFKQSWFRSPSEQQKRELWERKKRNQERRAEIREKARKRRIHMENERRRKWKLEHPPKRFKNPHTAAVCFAFYQEKIDEPHTIIPVDPLKPFKEYLGAFRAELRREDVSLVICGLPPWYVLKFLEADDWTSSDNVKNVRILPLQESPRLNNTERACILADPDFYYHWLNGREYHLSPSGQLAFVHFPEASVYLGRGYDCKTGRCRLDVKPTFCMENRVPLHMISQFSIFRMEDAQKWSCVHTPELNTIEMYPGGIKDLDACLALLGDKPVKSIDFFYSKHGDEEEELRWTVMPELWLRTLTHVKTNVYLGFPRNIGESTAMKYYGVGPAVYDENRIQQAVELPRGYTGNFMIIHKGSLGGLNYARLKIPLDMTPEELDRIPEKIAAKSFTVRQVRMGSRRNLGGGILGSVLKRMGPFQDVEEKLALLEQFAERHDLVLPEAILHDLSKLIDPYARFNDMTMQEFRNVYEETEEFGDAVHDMRRTWSEYGRYYGCESCGHCGSYRSDMEVVWKKTTEEKERWNAFRYAMRYGMENTSEDSDYDSPWEDSDE